jgi:hypothetical protein
MDLVVFSEKEIIPVLRALRAVAAANDSFTKAEADLVEAVGRLHGVAVNANALDPISFDELARAVTDSHRRKRAVQLAIVAALVEGPPDPRAEQAVADMGNVLGVPEAGIKVLSDVAGHHALLARIDMMRRMRKFITRLDGVAGLFRFAMPFLGLSGEDAEILARFRALGSLPQGTLGRELHDHYVDHGFDMPGSGGIPEKFVFHDIGHILSGYGVDPHGEIQQAAFQAGFIR